MSTWTSPSSPLFNIIKNGQQVNERVTNHALSNIAGNLEYLYDRIGRIEEDAAALVTYGAPISNRAFDEGDSSDLIKIGTPVYWDHAADQMGWAPAYVRLKDTSADGNANTTQHWDYDSTALASGIVVRRTDTLVDVVLSGNITLPLYDNGGSWEVGEEGGDYNNLLTNLFSSGDVSNIPSSFTESTAAPDSLIPGVYYLSTELGQLSPVNRYTRVMSVIFPQIIGDGYELQLVVCPEGFGGEKFHVHEKYDLDNNLAKGAIFDPDSLPYSWYPVVDDGERQYVNIAVGQVNPDSNLYPYDELLDGDGDPSEGATDAEHAAHLYNAAVPSTEDPGWLAVSDDFFDSAGVVAEDIPTGAIWGYTVSLDPRFTDEDPDSGFKWKPPTSFAQIILTQNGVPIPSSYYVIDKQGIWWIKEGVEHAPFKEVTGGVARNDHIEMWAIADYNEMEGRLVSSISSDEFVVDNDTGDVKIEPKGRYLEAILTPVLPLNPIDAFQFADDSEAREGTNLNKTMVPATVKSAIEEFAALGDTDAFRSCKVHDGTWNDLETSGLWLVQDVVHKPVELDVSETDYVMGFVGRSSTSSSGVAAVDHIFQICFDPRSRHEAYLRIGADQSFRPDTVVGSGTYWGDWMQITPRRDPIYLPGNGLSSGDVTTLNFQVHSNRELISHDEKSDVIQVASISDETNPAYVEAQNYRFINRTSEGTNKSVLVIRLQDAISGGAYTHLVNIAQSGEVADHFMGRIAYDVGATDSIPEYIHWAAYGDTIRVFNPSWAAQSYGDNRITLECINSSWAIEGGAGVWFLMDDTRYTDWVDDGANFDDDLMTNVLNGSIQVLNLSIKPIIAMSAYVDFSSATNTKT